MIKEHNGSTWHGKAYSKIVDTTQQVTSFPVVVRPMENSIPSWTIKGNLVQDGTPSPSNIIYPSECGEMTGNLFIQKLTGVTIASTGEMVSDANYDTYIAEVSDGETYTVSNVTGTQVYGFFTTKPTLGIITYNSSRTIFSTPSQTLTVPTGENIKYIGVRYNTGVSNAMLNTGSSPLPYEPYGYVLPIKSANTTTPVYLGQVQSKRRIRKLVLTGQENWTKNDASNPSNYLYYQTGYLANKTCVCSHLADMGTLSASKVGVFNGNKVLYLNFGSAIMNAQPSGNTVEGLKEYLAAQYSAGTPVTVWYVLATETTGIVNEPLRKIGTYSDSVSGTNLSVTAQSPTTIDVDTTLKPSEMDLTYTGLKMCGRKKYTGLLSDNPLCGISTYKDTLNLATGDCTRYVKKLVLTGEEPWQNNTNNACCLIYFSSANYGVFTEKDPLIISNAFAAPHNGQSELYNRTVDYGISFGGSGADRLCIRNKDYELASDFKAYLAQQYANGTPVCVWYVLATPITETIPVPEGLTGTVEGYLNQSGTPTPSTPIYPTANSVPYWQ